MNFIPRRASCSMSTAGNCCGSHVTSPALMNEMVDSAEPELEELLQHLQPVDLVLVEGFKMGDQPKIQVVRPANNTEVLPLEAQPIVAIASDEKVEPRAYGCDGPLLHLDDVASIAAFIVDYCGLPRRS